MLFSYLGKTHTIFFYWSDHFLTPWTTKKKKIYQKKKLTTKKYEPLRSSVWGGIWTFLSFLSLFDSLSMASEKNYVTFCCRFGSITPKKWFKNRITFDAIDQRTFFLAIPCYTDTSRAIMSVCPSVSSKCSYILIRRRTRDPGAIFRPLPLSTL